MVDKKQCSIAIIRLAIGGIGLLLAPLIFEIHFLNSYYIFSASAIFIGALMQLVSLNRKTSFAQRWEKIRTRPYIINVIGEGLYFSILIVIAVFVKVTFGSGHTLGEFFQLVTPSRRLLVLFIFIVAYFGSGVLSYRRKEKKFLEGRY